MKYGIQWIFIGVFFEWLSNRFHQLTMIGRKTWPPMLGAYQPLLRWAIQGYHILFCPVSTHQICCGAKKQTKKNKKHYDNNLIWYSVSHGVDFPRSWDTRCRVSDHVTIIFTQSFWTPQLLSRLVLKFPHSCPWKQRRDKRENIGVHFTTASLNG